MKWNKPRPAAGLPLVPLGWPEYHRVTGVQTLGLLIDATRRSLPTLKGAARAQALAVITQFTALRALLEQGVMHPDLRDETQRVMSVGLLSMRHVQGEEATLDRLLDEQLRLSATTEDAFEDLRALVRYLGPHPSVAALLRGEVPLTGGETLPEGVTESCGPRL